MVIGPEPAESKIVTVCDTRPNIVAALERLRRHYSNGHDFDAKRARYLIGLVGAGQRQVIFGGVSYQVLDGDATAQPH